MAKLSADKPLLHEDVSAVTTTFSGYVEIGRGTRIQNSHFGDYSYCDRYCDITNTQIGKFSNIASYARIGPTDHPMDRASLHHFMYRSADYWDDTPHDAAFFAHRASRVTIIGHDTWIGHGAVIKPELTIGDGAIIAAGAIVTKNVAPYQIVGGNPARLIRERQPADIAARLIALAWWDWSHEALGAALEDFRTLTAEAFLERYEGQR